MKKAFSIFIIIILLLILLINSVIFINSIIYPNEIPSFFGWKPFIVLSGSMETEIFPGDLVIVKEVDSKELKENDIIAFKSGDIVITHRIVEIINDEGQVKYITKGDNNNVNDVGYVTKENIEGIYKFKIKNLGNLAMFIQTPTGMVVCLSIPLLLLALVHIKENSDDREYLKEKIDEQRKMKREIEKLKKKNEELEREKINK